MKKSWLVAGCVAALIACPMTAATARAPVAAGDRIAPFARSGPLTFLSGVYGTHGSALEQVDEIVAKADAQLRGAGLGIGDMMQHTIFVKDGAASPIDVLARFHGAARRIAPGLLTEPSVGTVIRVPSFPDPNTLMMVDMTAGRAAKGAKLARIPFIFGPKDIAETIGTDNLVFSAGFEGMDFEHGTVQPTLDEQIETIVAKLDAAMRRAGLTLANMVSHTIYVTKGNDPIHVIQKFHETARRYAPGLKQHPSVGVIALVDGMAVPSFRMEMDIVAGRGDPAALARVPFTEMPMDIAKSVSAGGLVFLSGMEGIDFDRGNAIAPDLAGQVDASARKINTALRASGLSPKDARKFRLYVKQGEDPAAARATFHRALRRLDPAFDPAHVAETIILVEGLAAPSLKFEVTTIAARRP